MSNRQYRLVEIVIPAVLLFGLIYFFWSYRVIGPAEEVGSQFQVSDLYREHYPMAEYGFQRLARGEFPLWNPYQLCGVPFFAIPHVGLLYPGNIAYLFFEPDVATEVTLVAHWFLAAISMWLLARALTVTRLGAYASALTFVWSGWMFELVHQPSLISGMCWLPAFILVLERSLQGRSWASVSLPVVVALQILNGATEFFLHNMYAAGLYTLLRLIILARKRHYVWALKRGGIVLGGVTLGIFLSAVQLMPSIELAGLSVRSVGTLTFAEALSFLPVPPGEFFKRALLGDGAIAFGILPLVGITLGYSYLPYRRVWIYSVLTIVVTALLISGGPVYELYYATPLGSTFRRPIKFLHLHSFAQALLAGLGVGALGRLGRTGGSRIWSRPTWLLCVVATAASWLWLAIEGLQNVYLTAVSYLLLLFAALPTARFRPVLLLVMVMLQGTSLYFHNENIFVRPVGQPDIFHRYDPLLMDLKRHSAGSRVYLSRWFAFVPSLVQKQGMIKELGVVGDYEPLALERTQRYFEFAANREDSSKAKQRFAGGYFLSKRSRFSLLDVAATRFYVLARGKELDTELSDAANQLPISGFRLIRDNKYVRVYARDAALPRAYFVPDAIKLDDTEEVLTVLAREDFDPRQQLVLEVGDSPTEPERESGSLGGQAWIVDAAPERLEVTVEARQPGYLVLADTYYPGWKAVVDGQAVPVYRANYLFRAVHVETGVQRVVFTYEPASVRYGGFISLSSLFILVSWLMVLAWHAMAGRRCSEAAEFGLPANRNPPQAG